MLRKLLQTVAEKRCRQGTRPIVNAYKGGVKNLDKQPGLNVRDTIKSVPRLG